MSIIFTNPGEIDVRAIVTFGVSAKETDNPIGYFGTGLKYAIAVLLRNSQEITIYSGTECYVFNTKTITVRGKEWHSEPKPCKGTTLVIVDGDQFKHIYYQRHQYFLNKKDKPNWVVGSMEVYNMPTNAFFYKAPEDVKEHELPYHHRWSQPADQSFATVCARLIEEEDKRINGNAVIYMERIQPKEFNPEKLVLTPSQQAELIQAINFCERAGFPVTRYTINCVKDPQNVTS
ncbi:unnamed protein product [Sphagnum compactum]